MEDNDHDYESDGVFKSDTFDIKKLNDKYNVDKLFRKEFKKYCPEYDYMPSVYAPSKRIIVIGDLHGDLGVTIDSLRVAGVMSRESTKHITRRPPCIPCKGVRLTA